MYEGGNGNGEKEKEKYALNKKLRNYNIYKVGETILYFTQVGRLIPKCRLFLSQKHEYLWEDNKYWASLIY